MEDWRAVDQQAPSEAHRSGGFATKLHKAIALSAMVVVLGGVESTVATSVAHADQNPPAHETPVAHASDDGSDTQEQDSGISLTTQPPQKPEKHPKKPKKVHKKHANQQQTDNIRPNVQYDYNMHAGWGSVISGKGCGDVSLADAVSYELDKEITPTQMHPIIKQYFTMSGGINGSPYMAGAAPLSARHYGLREYKTTIDSGGAARAIKNGGAVIMLADGAPDSIITHAGHYFETNEIVDHKFRIHDPNQEPGRTFDKSLRSAGWLRASQVVDTVWVIMPKGK